MTAKATTLLSLIAISGWGLSILVYASFHRSQTSYQNQIELVQREYRDLLTSYKKMYREWVSPPDKIPATDTEREQLAISIINATRTGPPLHDMTWRVQYVSGFWYKVQYSGLDQNGTEHHSVVIYVNIATAELFGDMTVEIPLNA